MLIHLPVLCHVSHNRQSTFLVVMIACFYGTLRSITRGIRQEEWKRVICNHTYLPASASKRCYLQIPGHPLPPARETVTFQQEDTPCGFQGPGKNSSAVLWIYLSQYICYWMNYKLGFSYFFCQGRCEVRNMRNCSVLLSYKCIIRINISSSCRDLSHMMPF